MSAGPVDTLEITVQRKFAAGWPIVFEYSRADALSPIRSDGVLEFGDESIEELKSLLGQPREYGVRLGKALFQEEGGDAFVNARGQSEDRLRVLLCIEADDLRDLRWERLAAPIDGGGWDMLALNQRTPFCLYMPSNTDRRFPPIGRRDLRALLLVASPEDSVRYNLALFNVPETVAGVRSALGDIPCDVLANIDGAVGPPSLDGLCARLTDRSGRYTLLHVVCHGKVIEGGETMVYWAHADNRTEPVTATALLECLGRFGGLPYFAFLAACESASAEAEAALGGLAQRMVRGLGMPAVLAMTDRVTMQTAAALATAFYRQLGVSGEVDTALPEATAALARRGDVLVPALFSRLSRPLFSDLLDRELTNEEIKFGLDRLRALLVERAPVLQEEFEGQAAIVVKTLGADATALSKDAREERAQALGEINRLCEKEALDLSFNALALGKQPPQYDARCPFRGLYPFRLEDREFFFGREALIEKLRQKLAQKNFLPVLGSSGSGKTSVVLAGLAPALQDREKGLQLENLTPGSEPLLHLESTLAKLSDPPGVPSGVLVVDQFEELFTLCTDEAKRRAFIEQVLRLADSCRVVLTMRADFWGDCAPYKEFRERMEARQSLIPPMDAAELRKSMEQQAGQVGLRFQDGLSNRILDDVQGEPGAMPLLQHALFELWKRRHGRWLCWSEYEAIGGVQQAIAGTADRVYDRLSPAERPQVQNIFVRLTRVDVSTAREMRRDTRCRVWLEELVPAGDDPAVIEGLVQQLAGAEARLVVTGLDEATQRETVEVAHEALIQHWPRLQRWLDEDRANLLLRQSIHEAAEQWVDHAKEDSYLEHRGGRLEDAEALLHRPGFLNKREADYVRACADLRERERAAADRRRRKIIIASLAAAAVMAVLLVAATWSWIEADRQRNAAVAQRNEAQRNESRAFASLAENEVQRGSSATAVRLALVALPMRLESPDRAYERVAQGALLYSLQHVRERQRFLHQQWVGSVAFSPDGRTLATGSDDHTARLWEVATGREIAALRGHEGNVQSVAFSPDGRTLATAGSTDKTARLWEVATGREIAALRGLDNIVLSVAFSPDGKILASSWDGTARLWEVATGREIAALRIRTVSSVAFSSDGRTLAIGSSDGTARLWEVATGREIAALRGHEGDVQSVAFSSDGRTLATGSTDKTARLWEVATGREIAALRGHEGDVRSVAFSSDGRTLATGSTDKTARLWEVATGREIAALRGHEGNVQSVAFSSDGRTLATGSWDKTARLWEVASDREIAALRGHDNRVRSVAFSPDGKILATGSDDTTARLWDVASGTEMAALRGHDNIVRSVAFSPDGKILATGSDDTTARLWDVASGTEMAALRGHESGVWSVAFSPDGRTLATGSYDKTVRLWDVASGTEIAALRGLESGVWSVAFSPDGRTLATASGRTASLWKAGTSQPMVLRGHDNFVRSIAFSPDGKILATGSDDTTARLWEVATGREIAAHRVQRHRANMRDETFVSSVAFSADGRTLAIGALDTTARLWDVATRREIAVLRGHEGDVRSVVFSPDGRTLATGSNDKTARLWPVGQGLIDRACARVHFLPLSEEDKQRFGIEKEWCIPEVSDALRAKLGLDKPEETVAVGAAAR